MFHSVLSSILVLLGRLVTRTKTRTKIAGKMFADVPFQTAIEGPSIFIPCVCQMSTLVYQSCSAFVGVIGQKRDI